MKKKWKKQIDQIIKDTDFDKWACRMRQMNWRWRVWADPFIPDAEMIEEKSIELLTQVAEGGFTYACTGGITAIKAKGMLFLCLGQTTTYDNW